ncbi:MAG: GntR family transcriptional regulator [Treponema sp.]|nr:GntR family transcriptional regulator [Treponema sp.]
MSLASVRKNKKVTHQVFTQIINALKKGEFKPGDRLPGARELADKMQVGISSVREALKMLESLGAVESRQGEGTFICNTLREGAANAFEIQLALLPLTAEYLVEFRVIFETAYTRLAIKHATSADLANIEAAVISLEEKVKKSPDAFIEAEDELAFHHAVLCCTHNPYIIKTGEVALDLFFDVIHERLEPLVVSEAAKDHRDIYNAICQKDYELMDKVLNKCFSWWGNRFKE